MAGEKQKVIVALSGGLDSSVAAALLLEAGYDCHGVFMITSETNRHAQAGAEEVARRLGIELAILDLRGEFGRILDYFFGEYVRARTPNPCVLCNRAVKFGRLWEYASQAGASFLATGHYARILSRDGRPGLYQAADVTKDQSYVLSMVQRDVFSHVLLPMGHHTKTHARSIARQLGLGTETKAESQEICFIPNDDYVALLEERHPELVREGPIVDRSGKLLGTHQGIHRFTIGQRRGLRVAMGVPYYVTGLDAATNTVVLGPKEDVMHPKLHASGVNWLVDEPNANFRATVKIRYNDRGKPATVYPEGDAVQVEFDQPNMAITPGQLAVFYVEQDDLHRVAGAAWIDAVAD
ncbi:MAG: tRNA 2-thiouridine(34) synthase MnmA [Sedimentisphaerales bacterium]|nr:tRNA 2-thiouridine(34) synthase MnmA [Sedimentisphaerales bacterium]